MNRFIASVIILLLPCIDSPAASFKLDVVKKVFPNGLTVLVQENHAAPIVSYQTWFKIGSRHELPGKTGLAHLFEHLMFKGTPKYSARSFEKTLENNGITHNAFTTQDYTVYFEDLPSDKLEIVMDIESDRLANLILNKDVFDSEKKVVQEERLLRVEESIDGTMSEKLWAGSFKVHPYKNPVVGWPQDAENLTLEDAIDFFKGHYSVSRAIISVSGDVDAASFMALIDKYYGTFKKVESTDKPAPKEPPLEKELRIQGAREDAKSERLLLGYRIGKAGEQDSFVMDIISDILTQGQTSRLYKKLVFENQMATDVQSFASTPEDPGLLEIAVSLRPSVKIKEVLPVIDSEIEKLQKFQIKLPELQKVKMRLVKATLSSLKTCHGRAHNLALNEMVTGNYQNLFDDLDQYEKITAKNVMDVAKKSLNPNNRIRVEVVPK